MKYILLLALSFSVSAMVMTKTNANKIKLTKKVFDISELIQDYAKVRSYNLIIADDIKGKVYLFGQKEFEDKDLDLYISTVANESGYTILKDEELNQIEIINARDIRYRSNTLYEDINDVPDDYNHYKFTTKLMHMDVSQYSRNMRPFMSRYGRIIDVAVPNTVIISDTGRNIKRLYKLLKLLDTPSYVKREMNVNKINEKNKEIVVEKESVLNVIKDQHILFLIAFTLLGGIIGFGISNAINRKQMEW